MGVPTAIRLIVTSIEWRNGLGQDNTQTALGSLYLEFEHKLIVLIIGQIETSTRPWIEQIPYCGQTIRRNQTQF